MQDVLGSIIESIFLSVYGIFFAVAVYSILRKGLKTQSSIIMLVVVVYLYMASVVEWALDLDAVFDSIHFVLMVPDTPIPDRGYLVDENRAIKLSLACKLSGCSIVVIWRTWAVYQHRILAILLPSLLLLMSFVFAVIDTTCMSYLGPLPGGEQICPVADTITWAFSVATNVACTILIWFKAWQHRKMMRGLNLPGKSYRMSTEKILSILVESASYTLSQVINHIEFNRDSPWFFVNQFIWPMGNQFAGMYPTLIIVIVNFRRTIWEEGTSGISNGASVNTLPWGVKRPGPIDTFGTQTGVHVHLQTVVEITRENLGNQSVKRLPSEDV
ncbi:hypothetical protein DFH08DRAFT_946586 [Mycena albidolilacea]|uniref:Uncharacterized protein n=1 Tax=Mycena albidolilacea TaxID=1033008 RepID=A0AAD7AT49_9AGAR|nr:hypothetical protein DFH08DRAFT_946586 [Mycena albidolilacea]